jgi:hypothetical protein
MLTPAQLDRRSLLKGITFGAGAVSPPSLPNADPRSDRFRFGGHESEFLALIYATSPMNSG